MAADLMVEARQVMASLPDPDPEPEAADDAAAPIESSAPATLPDPTPDYLASLLTQARREAERTALVNELLCPSPPELVAERLAVARRKKLDEIVFWAEFDPEIETILRECFATPAEPVAEAPEPEQAFEAPELEVVIEELRWADRFLPWRWKNLLDVHRGLVASLRARVKVQRRDLKRLSRQVKRHKAELAECDTRLETLERQAAELAAHLASVYGLGGGQ